MRLAALLPAALVAAGCTHDGDPSAPVHACAAPVTALDEPRPRTIPALRTWEAAPGSYTFTSTSRIVAGDGLQEVAQTFADDLSLIAGRPVAVGEGGEGDIVLAIADCDTRLGGEGYALTLGGTAVVQARTARGAFYGTRTLLQLLKQGAAVPAGRAADWPRYPERGLMVDIGRKHFTAQWLRRHVRELAWLKMNVLHLHFSENLGFRVESLRHSEIVSAQHLSQAEVREIVALAARHFVTVVPEIDMPGHMGAALAPHPEFQLTDPLGQKAVNNLDVTNPAAVQFARELIEEFLPLFPAPYWHQGADEYLTAVEYQRYPQLRAHAVEQYGAGANAKDAVLGFVNGIAALVRSHGRTPRAWHDALDGGGVVTADPGIVVEWWTNFSPVGDLFAVPTPQELLDRGHAILNAGWFPTYYVVGGAFGVNQNVPPEPDMATAYEDWQPHEFYGPLNLPAAGGTQPRFPPDTVAADEPRNVGSVLHVWCDGPDAQTEDEVAGHIAPRLRVLAQKTWSSELLVPDYAGFLTIAEAVGESPGFNHP